jgi:hypothetical protein
MALLPLLVHLLLLFINMQALLQLFLPSFKGSQLSL